MISIVVCQDFPYQAFIKDVIPHSERDGDYRCHPNLWSYPLSFDVIIPAPQEGLFRRKGSLYEGNQVEKDKISLWVVIHS